MYKMPQQIHKYRRHVSVSFTIVHSPSVFLKAFPNCDCDSELLPPCVGRLHLPYFYSFFFHFAPIRFLPYWEREQVEKTMTNNQSALILVWVLTDAISSSLSCKFFS